MCIVEKCCYYIPLNLACVLLAIGNFVISIILTITSIACYFNEQDNMKGTNLERPHLVAEFLGIDLKMETVNIILSIVVIIGLFWMIFSVLLFVGVIKNEPNLVLCYFTFGVLLTIIWQLGGLILLLNKCWWLAIIIIIVATINIHFIMVVYTVYEHIMQGNKAFMFRRHLDEDELPIAESFEANIDV